MGCLNRDMRTSLTDEVKGMEFPLHIRDIWISDPYVLADPKTGLYYIYSRAFSLKDFVPDAPGCFYAICSRDLIHWSVPRVVFEQEDFWADKDYWAPECWIWQGKYYLVSSFRAEGTYRACQFLVADHPLGPFKPYGEPLTPKGWQCLDGTLFVDEGGSPWLVFCHEWVQVFDGQVAAVRLSPDLAHAVSDPIILFRASDAPWRGPQLSQPSCDGGNVTDGPFLHRMNNGSLIMLWSNYCPDGYAVGYARSLSGSIRGPWVQEKTPLYAFDGGHAMLFHTFEGQLMMALHCPNTHGKKRALLFEMEERGDKLCIVNEVTGNWYDRMGGGGGKYRYAVPALETGCFRLGIGNQEVHLED